MAQASAEKLEHTGLAEKERVASVPQREQLARTPEPPLPKGKGTDAQSRVPDHKRRESRWARAALWRGGGRLEREHGEERVDSTVKEGKFQEGKGRQVRRASLMVEESMSG